jgi:two-component system phosphate regulon sensor histidine kinase PhoR
MGELAHLVRTGDATRVGAAVVAATTDGVAVLDAGGRFVLVNPSLAAALGTPAERLIGQSLATFVVHPHHHDGVTAALTAARTTGRWRGELRGPVEDGTPVVWDVTLAPVDGTGIAAVFRDVSEKHALEQLRADFLSMLVHDIKAPLTVILGYVELLGDPPASLAMLEETLPRIRESGEQIHGLVSNFLDLSRIESGRLRLDPRVIDLGELVHEVVEQYVPRARRKRIMLTHEREGRTAISADAPQLERVITNLLGNAIKYTPADGTVIVTTAVRDGAATVSVRDTGPGVPAELLPHLFEKYRRARESRRVEGTGLGLFIAKTIAEAHGGRIAVETAPGAGSTFSVALPLA